jgi:hypothetical protein
MLSYELKHIIEIIVGDGDDDDEECDKCEEDEDEKDEDQYKEKQSRTKLYGSGDRKLWQPGPTSSGSI